MSQQAIIVLMNPYQKNPTQISVFVAVNAKTD